MPHDPKAAGASAAEEALRLLEKDGLVTNHLHRGVQVAALSFQRALDITEVRMHLEALAARAAELTPRGWAEDAADANEVNAWIVIEADDSIALRCPMAEMGQGGCMRVALRSSASVRPRPSSTSSCTSPGPSPITGACCRRGMGSPAEAAVKRPRMQRPLTSR